jgi:general transcriptional corepressor TUP1
MAPRNTAIKACPASASVSVMASVEWHRSRSSPEGRMAFAPDGKNLTSGNGTLVRLWSGDNGQALATMEGHASEIQVAEFSTDGRYLATGDGDGVGRIWSVASRKEAATIKAPGSMHGLAVSPDGRSLETSHQSESFKLWDVLFLAKQEDQARNHVRLLRSGYGAGASPRSKEL